MSEYSAGLTGEPFLYNETKIIARFLLEGENPEDLRKRNVEENLIQHKKVESIKRTNSPIFKRLKIFNDNMLFNFVNGDIVTSKMLLVYSIMKTDLLVKDFIFEVYREKILLMKDYIEPFDITNWFDEKYATPALSKISESTKYKLKQVMMKIMQDSGLVEKENERFRIIIPLLNDTFKTLLLNNNDIEYFNAIGGLV